MYVCMYIYIAPAAGRARPPHIRELTHREHWVWCECVYIHTNVCAHAHMRQKI